jgi:hypothetical protein
MARRGLRTHYQAARSWRRDAGRRWITMRLGRIDRNAHYVIDSNKLERDAGGKVDPLFLTPL